MLYRVVCYIKGSLNLGLMFVGHPQDLPYIVVKLAVEQGLEAALIEWTSATGSPLPAVAWLRSGDLERAADYAALAIDGDPDCPVLAWLAAVVGPDVSELAEVIQGRLSHDAAHAGFRRWTG